MKLEELTKVDLNLLVAGSALLEEQSVTRAARRLGVTQSSASHALSRLRDLFGDPLLVRSNNEMVLTPRAKELAPAIETALSRLGDLLAQRPAFDPRHARATFVINASDYGALVVIPELVSVLSKEAPHVDVVVRPASNDSARMLAQGAADLALGPIVDAAPDLVSAKAFEDRFLCVARKDHPKLRDGLDLEQYLALPHVLVAPRGLRPSQVDVALSRAGAQRRVGALLPHFLPAPYVVASSDMVMTIPKRLADLACGALPLARYEPPIAIEGFTFHLIWHASRQDDAPHVWLRATLRRICDSLRDAR